MASTSATQQFQQTAPSIQLALGLRDSREAPLLREALIRERGHEATLIETRQMVFATRSRLSSIIPSFPLQDRVISSARLIPEDRSKPQCASIYHRLSVVAYACAEASAWASQAEDECL